MKNNTLVKTIIALFFAAALIGTSVLSCLLNDADGKGTLNIKLPGNNSARTLSDEYLGSLTYTLDFTGPGKTQAKKAGAGENVTIILSAGSWDIDVKVFDSNSKIVGGGETTTVNVEVGVVTPVTIYVFIDPESGKDSSGYFGNNMRLSGQVYIYDTDENDNFISYNEFKTSSRIVFSSYLGGTGTISETGIMDFTIGIPSSSELIPIEYIFAEYSGDSDDGSTIIHDESITFSPSGVKGAHLLAFDNAVENMTLCRETMETDKYGYENVSYIYVDTDVKMIVNNTSQHLVSASLDLKSGWNAFHIKYSGNGDDGKFIISISNPDHLKWILYKSYDEPNVPGETYQQGQWPDAQLWGSFGFEGGLQRDTYSKSTYFLHVDKEKLMVVFTKMEYDNILGQIKDDFGYNNGAEGNSQEEYGQDQYTVSYMTSGIDFNLILTMYSTNEDGRIKIVTEKFIENGFKFNTDDLDFSNERIQILTITRKF